MDHFNYRDDALYVEDVPLMSIAGEMGTPCYVYSRATIERHWHAFDNALGQHDHLVCYAVKANSNIGLLNVLARLGSGFDIVSGGELARVLRAGGEPGKIVFSGVGKRADEIRDAISAGILCFNVESAAELDRINTIAGEMGQRANISIRVNPDVDAGSHPYISTGLRENKFGININDAPVLYQSATDMANINIVGIDVHIGSQLTSLEPFGDALQRVLILVDKLDAMGIAIRHIDLGGGLGIQYQNETPPDPAAYAADILAGVGGRSLQIIIEPGRAIVGNAGVLLTRVEYLKHTDHKHFAIVDAAMNDLIRPSLYSAWHDILPVNRSSSADEYNYDVVGPVCESGDFIGKDRQLSLNADDLLAIRSAGAYGFALSSNYNSRPRAAEVMADGDQMYVVRQRETVDTMLTNETLLPE